MADLDLLETFEGKVATFAKYREFMAKAQAAADKFSPEVVAKVVSDNEAKSLEAVGEIIMLVPDTESAINELNEAKNGVTAGGEDKVLALQELELRQAIGDVSDEDFEKESAELKEFVDGIEGKVAELQAELDRWQAALEHWTTVGTEAGVLL